MTKPHVYIAVSGGVVQGVRIAGVREADCTVVDYDDFDDEESQYGDGDDFERALLGGVTWDELSEESLAIY